ncbi:MAG: ABC transporter permease subunit [Lachnospiraceae bacterium]|nr:ABC transporter permease subunit [Lachnospiraceae bacterium]
MHVLKQKASDKKRYILFAMMMLLIATFSVGCGKTEEVKPAKVVASVDDLEGANVGVQLGTTGDIYITDYEGDEAGTKISRFNKGADAVQALKQGKVDCVLIDEQPALSFVEKNPELKILEEEFAIEEYAICIAKENTKLKQQVNDALAELQTEGVVANIINNYIGDDTKGKTPYESPEDVDRSNGTLTMATNVGFPPYEYYENGVPTGIDVDLAQAIADKLGMELEITDVEFDSIIISVQAGKADIGVAGMTVTEDRLKNIDFSETYTTAKQVIIVKGEYNGKKLSFKERFHNTFIVAKRWEYIPKGLLNTVLITVCAGLIGIVLGFLLAFIRVAHDRSGEGGMLVAVLNVIAKIYLTVFRGTPVMVQLLIMYYVVFGAMKLNPVIAAVIAFGLNSAAYVAEAIRSGIVAVEIGQFEAGRSLGFTYGQTMWNIILPQAIKNSLPAMCNEFISLLKESSIVGYIGLMDLTKSGDILRSTTFEAMLPLLCVALVYLAIVMVMTAGVNRLERRLKKDAR